LRRPLHSFRHFVDFPLTRSYGIPQNSRLLLFFELLLWTRTVEAPSTVAFHPPSPENLSSLYLFKRTFSSPVQSWTFPFPPGPFSGALSMIFDAGLPGPGSVTPNPSFRTGVRFSSVQPVNFGKQVEVERFRTT